MSGSGLAAVHAAATAVPGATQEAALASVSFSTTAELVAAFPQLCANIRAEAATAERDRILGIQSHAMVGHEQLITSMVADPTVTPDMAAGRILSAERAARASQLQGIQDVETHTSRVAAAPAAASPAAAPAAGKLSAQQLAGRARDYQAEQAKLGNKVSAAQAVSHVEQQLGA